ncbi:MAG: TolC family protein [Burkholderiaceae bacterium]
MSRAATTRNSPLRRGRRAHHALLALIAAAAAGCATVDPEQTLEPVRTLAGPALGPSLQWARDDDARAALDTRVGELLSAPLSMDAAVQVALLNNRGLQAEFDALGISEAERLQAGRLPNPGFSFARLRRGDEREIERSFHFDLARLIFMPTIGRLEARRHAREQRRVAMAVLDLAARTRQAWVDAVAAREALAYADQVKRTADTSAMLARRMAQAGNFSKLQQAREQGFYADAAINRARAELAATIAREQLVRLLGVHGEQLSFTLPARLPDLPDEPRDIPDVVRTALAQRLDVQAARIAVEQLAENLGMVRTNRFIEVLEVGVIRNGSNEAPTQTGWEIGLELPLFDWGTARVARAEAAMRQATNAAARTAIEARSEVRQAYVAYRTAYDIARQYRDEIVPLRQRIAEENLYRYNGMLIGVFELLADARAQVGAVEAYMRALRDFWVAQADLDAAMIGRPALTPVGDAPAAMNAGADAGH